MTTDGDLIKLYSGRILALAADIPFADPLDMADGTAMRRSPQCGSKVTVALNLDADGKICAYSQDVKACALGQASASLSGAPMLGRTLVEVTAARDALQSMLAGELTQPVHPFDGYEVLTPAIAFKNRHTSILLALEATIDAIADAQAKKTAAL